MNTEEPSLPGYRRVKQLLVQQVTEGRMKPGDRITSERALADSLGVSRLTIARAIGELVLEGLLVRRRGSGTYVADWRRRAQENRTGQIGLILPHTTDVPSSELIRGVTAALRDSGLHTILADSSNEHAQEASLLSSLRRDRVDGLIIMPVDGVHNIPIYHELTYAGIPFVLVDRYLPAVDCDYVVADNHWGAFQATQWLIEHGHRRIAHFTVFNSRSSSVCQRQQGYLDALSHHDIPRDADLICPPSVYEHRVLAYKHALAYVRGLEDPATAVFAMNDSVVWATLQGAADLGLKLPQDMELAGFFDSGSRIGVTAPFLKVSQPSFDMGRIAAEALLDAIDTGMEHQTCKLSLKPSLDYSGATEVVSTDASIVF